jgi:hypothetical protein
MSTVARTGIFIAYHYPEKRWLDRVQAALQPVAGNEPITIWDDRKLLGGSTWKTELAEVLAHSKVVVLIVSDPFLLSGFITRAKLPALLDRERANGLRICWVLAGYCLFSVAGLRAEEAGNGINAALDGLSGAGRDSELAEVARKISLLLAAPPVPVASPAVPASAVSSEGAEVTPATPREVKPRREKRKRAAAAKPTVEPLELLPLVTEPTAPPLAPPPPQPQLQFPAPKPQTHLTPPEPELEAAPESLPAAPPVAASEVALTPPQPVSEPAPVAAKLAPASVQPAPHVPLAPPAQIVARTQTEVPAEPPPRRADSPILPALDTVVQARQQTIDQLCRLARWMKFAALGVAVLSLPAALGTGLTHFLLIFGFALFLGSLALFLHARIALLGQRLVGLRYTRSGLADELIPNRQREPLLRRAMEILG